MFTALAITILATPLNIMKDILRNGLLTCGWKAHLPIVAKELASALTASCRRWVKSRRGDLELITSGVSPKTDTTRTSPNGS